MLIGVDRYDVKPANTVRKLRPLRKEHGSCANKFALLVNINRQAGAGKTVARAVAHFDEYQAVSVLHNQVDLAKTSSIILADQGQALAV